jgi:hypothetical protein
MPLKETFPDLNSDCEECSLTNFKCKFVTPPTPPNNHWQCERCKFIGHSCRK